MMCENSLTKIRQLAQHLVDTKTFDQVLKKVKIVSAGNGECKAEFTVEREHSNLRKTLHGGFTGSLVDMISTFALMTTGKEVPGASVDIHITYMKAAKEGEEVLVEAKTIRAGRTLAFLDVHFRNKRSGQILAIGTHTKYLA